MYIHLCFICIYLCIIGFRIATVKTENNKYMYVGVFSQNILHLCRPPGQAMFVLMHSMNLSMQLHVVHYKEIQLSRGFGIAALRRYAPIPQCPISALGSLVSEKVLNNWYIFKY